MTLNHYPSYQKHPITLLFENPEKWTPKAYIFKHFALKVTPAGELPRERVGCSRGSGPIDRNRIIAKNIINGHYCHPMLYGLAHQHPVKRVSVNRWQFGQMSNTGFIQRQTEYLMTLTL